GGTACRSQSPYGVRRLAAAFASNPSRAPRRRGRRRPTEAGPSLTLRMTRIGDGVDRVVIPSVSEGPGGMGGAQTPRHNVIDLLPKAEHFSEAREGASVVRRGGLHHVGRSVAHGFAGMDGVHRHLLLQAF